MPIEIQARQIAGFDFAAASITTEASITATGSATGDTCISTGRFGLENAGDYYVEVFSPYLTKGSTNLDIELFEGATAATGTFLQTLTGHMIASTILGAGWSTSVKVTLAAGGHQLTATGFGDAGAGKVGAGTG